MRTLITICARGGSKGIPGKNIKELNGKPLIEYTIILAFKFKEQHPSTDIELSTDSLDIKKVASSCGLDTNYVRPGYLANDTCGKVDAIVDLVKYAEKKNECIYDYVLDMDVTSPLRNLEDLNNAFMCITKDKRALNLFSVSEPSRNPYFNMVEEKENGYYAQVKRLQDGVFSRQSAPKVFDMNASFYIYTKQFFEKGLKSAITDKSLIYLMPHICFDLDHPIDFEFISYLICNNKLNFNL